MLRHWDLYPSWIVGWVIRFNWAASTELSINDGYRTADSIVTARLHNEFCLVVVARLTITRSYFNCLQCICAIQTCLIWTWPRNCESYYRNQKKIIFLFLRCSYRMQLLNDESWIQLKLFKLSFKNAETCLQYLNKQNNVQGILFLLRQLQNSKWLLRLVLVNIAICLNISIWYGSMYLVRSYVLEIGTCYCIIHIALYHSF